MMPKIFVCSQNLKIGLKYGTCLIAVVVDNCSEESHLYIIDRRNQEQNIDLAPYARALFLKVLF